jgi:tetratricopeptide (TPR) repeat protein
MAQDKASLMVAIAREALRLHGDNPLSWLRLAEALMMSNELGEALSVLQEGMALHSTHRDLAFAAAEAFIRCGQLGEGLSLFEQHVRRWPRDLGLRLRQFELLVALGRIDAARTVARGLQFGSQELLAVHSMDSGRRYQLAVAMALSGREAEAAAVLPLEGSVSIVELPWPAKFRDGSEFRRELTREILANDSLAADPAGKAIRGGMQTRDLMNLPTPAVAALMALLAAQVDAFDPTKTALGIRPARYQLKAWGVVYGEAGFQTSHIHPQGWLSGVYYVSPEAGYAGALLLGALPEVCAIDPPWGLMRVAPVAGRLVLFPSWLPHATERAGGDEQRICVAFDVVPLTSG